MPEIPEQPKEQKPAQGDQPEPEEHPEEKGSLTQRLMGEEGPSEPEEESSEPEAGEEEKPLRWAEFVSGDDDEKEAGKSAKDEDEHSEDDDGREEQEKQKDPKIYVVKVTTNQEKIVAKLMYDEAIVKRQEGKEQSDIYSIMYAPELKGYVLVEADNPGTVEDLARGISHAKGLLLRKKGDLKSAGIITLDELQKILRPQPMVEKVNKGDLVELITGPFKGEKARVARIDNSKNQITVELIEAAVPIPVIVKGYDIRILKREGISSEEEKG